MPVGLNFQATHPTCSAPSSFCFTANSRALLLSCSSRSSLFRSSSTDLTAPQPIKPITAPFALRPFASSAVSWTSCPGNKSSVVNEPNATPETHGVADQGKSVIRKYVSRGVGDSGSNSRVATLIAAMSPPTLTLRLPNRGKDITLNTAVGRGHANKGGTNKGERPIFARKPQSKWFCGSTFDGRASSTNQRPWVKLIETREVDTMLRLDEEIRAFERYITPTAEEDAATERLIARVKGRIAVIAPCNEVFLHGSRYTKLASPLSDIDFCVALPEYEKDPLERGPSASRPKAQAAKIRLLRRVMNGLSPFCSPGSVELVRARVDLVEAIDAATGIRLQISTLAPFSPAREYTMNYLAEYPGLRPLFLLLRHALLIREHVGVHEGGLGSYPLLIMIVTAIKHSLQPISSKGLGEQLLHVLSFWSKADLCCCAYSVEPVRVFPKGNMKMSTEAQTERLNDPYLRGMDKLRRPDPTKPWLLCLQDPGNATNDLGKRTTQIREIQKLFEVSYVRILRLLEHWDRIVELGLHEPYNYKTYTFLDPLVRADYDDFEARRKIVAGGQFRWSCS